MNILFEKMIYINLFESFQFLILFDFTKVKVSLKKKNLFIYLRDDQRSFM